MISSSVKKWVVAARPKTLTAAAAPVIVGLCFASKSVDLNWLVAFITLFAATFIQVGTNFANDFYDFIKGADTESRLGPPRAILTGDVTATQMLFASLISFFISAVFGFFLVLGGGLPILVIGVISLLSGFFYTAGPYPLAYLGLGDIFVFVFFGPVAVSGTCFLQTGNWDPKMLLPGAVCGLLSTAILVVNNQRDVQEDRLAEKKTVAVRFGTGFTKVEYFCCYILATLCILGTAFCFGFSQLIAFVVLLPLFFNNMRKIMKVDSAEEYNKLLESSAKLVLLYAILVTIGVSL